MNEKEFNVWVEKTIPATFPILQTDMYLLKSAWLESARRADRKAREECAEICDRLHPEPAWVCEDAIRATIPESADDQT